LLFLHKIPSSQRAKPTSAAVQAGISFCGDTAFPLARNLTYAIVAHAISFTVRINPSKNKAQTEIHVFWQ